MELSFQTILYIIGGVVAGWVLSYIKSRFEVATYKKELKEYKEHLNRQMAITGEGTKNLEKEIKELKKENENLKVSVQTLSQKPGRSELKLLSIYDATLRKMMLKAPGFSPAWEASLQESEKAYIDSEKGLKSIVRKVFGSSLTHNIENSVENELESSENLENKKGN